MSIRQHIQDLAGKGMVTNLIGIVMAVFDNAVDVDPVNGDSRIFDVRLQASEDTGSILMKPKKGSYVIVTMLNGTQGYVSGMSSIDTVGININGVDISKKIDELSKILSSVADVIQNLKVVTPMGPSTALLPDSLSSLASLNSDIAGFKRDLNSIIKPM